MRVQAVIAMLIAILVQPGLAQESSRRRSGPTFEGGSLPQTPIDPVKPSDPVDTCKATIAERNGVVMLSLDDPSRADRTTTITLDSLSFAGRFDRAGHLQIEAPLFHRLGDLEWEGDNGQKCHRHGVLFSNWQSTFEIALIWRAQSEGLSLHTVEPGGRVGGPQYYVFPGRPNLDNSYALGHLQTFGAPVPGTTQVQLYSLPQERNPHDGTIYAFVEFSSRGNPARAPFCGQDIKADVTYELIRLDAGVSERRKGGFKSVPCGTVWAGGPEESGYFQMWKYRL